MESSTIASIAALITALGLGSLIPTGWSFLLKKKKSATERANAIIDQQSLRDQNEIAALKQALIDQANQHRKEIAEWKRLVEELNQAVNTSQKQLTKALIVNASAVTAIKMAISFIERTYPDEETLISALKEHIKTHEK